MAPASISACLSRISQTGDGTGIVQPDIARVAKRAMAAKHRGRWHRSV